MSATATAVTGLLCGSTGRNGQWLRAEPGLRGRSETVPSRGQARPPQGPAVPVQGDAEDPRSGGGEWRAWVESISAMGCLPAQLCV